MLALAEAEKILNLKIPVNFDGTADLDDPNFIKFITRKQAVIASVLSATVRVTAGRLRGKERDRMADILAEMKAHKDHLKTLN